MRFWNGGHSSSEVRSEVNLIKCRPGEPKQRKSFKYIQLRPNIQQRLKQNSSLRIDFNSTISGVAMLEKGDLILGTEMK